MTLLPDYPALAYSVALTESDARAAREAYRAKYHPDHETCPPMKTVVRRAEMEELLKRERASAVRDFADRHTVTAEHGWS